jgi:hypothetical protein
MKETTTLYSALNTSRSIHCSKTLLFPFQYPNTQNEEIESIFDRRTLHAIRIIIKLLALYVRLVISIIERITIVDDIFALLAPPNNVLDKISRTIPKHGRLWYSPITNIRILIQTYSPLILPSSTHLLKTT